LIDSQVRLTRRFDCLLPVEFPVACDRDFLDDLAPRYLQPGALLYHAGGGKNPVIGRQLKSDLRLRNVGLDIYDAELEAAPRGPLRRNHVRGYCRLPLARRRRSGDLPITFGSPQGRRPATAAISSILKPGGGALIYVPCRNAVFARMNPILPEGIKRRILFGVFPKMRRDHGSPACYNRCTPSGFDDLARWHALIPESRRLYFTRGRFRFCLPLHAVWRIQLLMFRWMAGTEAAETFAVIFRKEQGPS
jgi:2-polyprenyl-6-hydroxyphenyl methylase/3-demethylubiquinone-9 3-methyltransferase